MGQTGSAIPAPRATCGGGDAPNNLPPLSFHRVHGDNVRLSGGGATARRVESFCKGIVFSARPVRVFEKVCVRFTEISDSWSGVLRFGFTSNNPATLSHCLPKYACPDLTNKPGYWAKSFAERWCEKDNVLFYYFTPTGEVHFGINGDEKGVFLTGVPTRSALWALLDIYGNCTGLQFYDARAPSLRRSLPASEASSEPELNSSMRSLSIEEQLPPCRFPQAVQPLVLHRMRGRNVQSITDRGVASRVVTEFCQGYVFTARPMRPGETIVIQILATEIAYAGSLAIGLTSCDPATLRPSELPDDAESLLDRPEYWVVRRDAGNGMRRGDEMAVTLTVDGEVRVSRNGHASTTVMHVDHTLRLWAFVDVYGATQKVRLLGTTVATPVQTPQSQLRLQLANGGAALNTSGGGTVLVVSLPPQGQPPQAYLESMTPQSQLCLSGVAQWAQESCASTSQNNANTSLVDLQPAPPLPPPPIAQYGHVSQSSQNLPHASQAHHMSHPSLMSHASQVSVVSHHSNSAHTLNNGQMPNNHVGNSHIQNSGLVSQNSVHIAGHARNELAPAPCHAQQSSNHMVQISNHAPQTSAHLAQHSSHMAQSSGHMAQSSGHMVHGHMSSHASSVAHSSHQQPIYSVIGEQMGPLSGAGAECTICYENPIDSVLYMCGHMCMCYRCAVQQWRGKGGGQCPLCRAHIKDVIRTYKS